VVIFPVAPSHPHQQLPGIFAIAISRLLGLWVLVDKTFRAISYHQLPEIITRNIANKKEQKQILEILQQRSPTDAYYTAWIRTGDINVLMRLRDWRPNGEVIAPLSIREQLVLEARHELANYER
jgi:CRISPR-associated protein (TIGR03985 family)